MNELFDRQLSEWGLGVDAGAEGLLLAFARILSEYDKANVIGTRDRDEILQRHILDSLSCLIFDPLREADKIADIGSGGGLPGIPLAMTLGDTEVTLFESVGKKAAFLRYAAERLKLENVRVVNSRIEDAAKDEAHRGGYDACVVRALARLSVIAEYSLPLLRKGGYTVAMKGREDGGEIAEAERALGVLGGRLDGQIPVSQVSRAEQKERRLMLLHKIGETPRAYPRKPGTPAKAPLGREA